MSGDEPKIKVFASDDNLKALGELLSNDSSRKIIYHLMTKEMYTNEISTKLDMRVSLVIHHLKKLEELEMLIITNKKIKRKGQEHRFFKINSDIFVTIDKTKEEIKETGFLKKIFKESIKFSSIIMSAIFSYFLLDTKYPLSPNEPDIAIVPQSGTVDPLIYSLIIVILGLLVLYFLKIKKNVN